MSRVRAVSPRGYARGNIVDAWRDTGTGGARPAPHHGPGQNAGLEGMLARVDEGGDVRLRPGAVVAEDLAWP